MDYFPALRDGDPEFRHASQFGNEYALIKSPSDAIFQCLLKKKVITSDPLSVLGKTVASTEALSTAHLLAFRLIGSDWLQINTISDAILPLNELLRGPLSKLLKTCVYLTNSYEGTWGYDLYDSGKLVESYARSEDEPIYEYIPEEECEGIVARSDGQEYLKTKSPDPPFDPEAGLEDGHEAKLLADLGCRPVAVDWTRLSSGIYHPTTGFKIEDFEELWMIPIVEADYG